VTSVAVFLEITGKKLWISFVCSLPGGMQLSAGLECDTNYCQSIF